jgi:hypothetical protein
MADSDVHLFLVMMDGLVCWNTELECMCKLRDCQSDCTTYDPPKSLLIDKVERRSDDPMTMEGTAYMKPS